MNVEFEFTLESLGIDTKHVAVVPSGGEAFGASTFIGPWEAFIGQRFLTLEDYILFNQDNDDPAPVPDIRVQWGDYYTHYYRDYAAALDAYEKLTDGEYKTHNVWVFYVDTAKLVGLSAERMSSLKDGFGDRMVQDLRAIAPRKGSSSYRMVNRHQYTMIALPSIVAVTAEAFHIEHSPFTIDELCTGEEFSDEGFAEAFGDLDGQYQDSIWWKKRVELWESLGESEARKQAVKGSLTATGRPNSLATVSDNLNRCLMLAQGTWSRPVWCAVTLVPDPMPEAVTKSGNRLNIPVVTKLFSGETEATEYARLLNEGEGEESHPKLPANWVGTGICTTTQ
jgi:hypothetical protein